MQNQIARLLDMAHELGRADRSLAILGEGNVSAKLDDARFAVKATGCALATLTERDVTICDTKAVLAMWDEDGLTDDQVEHRLLKARVDTQARKPSIETMFHAWLLTLPGVEFVAHSHPLCANQVLCSPRARDFAERRMFPDQIVYCGATSVFVPYADPGLPLARKIAECTRRVYEKISQVPRLILLENHGIIALGATMEAALACALMAEKAAAIFMGAAALGGPNFLSRQHVERIATRRDEVQRQAALRTPQQHR
jgi:rhamnose utilization protein RhaD (predicted bifunctional aldolase and dehydrogenase)